MDSDRENTSSSHGMKTIASVSGWQEMRELKPMIIDTMPSQIANGEGSSRKRLVVSIP